MHNLGAAGRVFCGAAIGRNDMDAHVYAAHMEAP
jgi:hypothetical protein